MGVGGPACVSPASRRRCRAASLRGRSLPRATACKRAGGCAWARLGQPARRRGPCARASPSPSPRLPEAPRALRPARSNRPPHPITIPPESRAHREMKPWGAPASAPLHASAAAPVPRRAQAPRTTRSLQSGRPGAPRGASAAAEPSAPGDAVCTTRERASEQHREQRRRRPQPAPSPRATRRDATRRSTQPGAGIRAPEAGGSRSHSALSPPTPAPASSPRAQGPLPLTRAGPCHFGRSSAPLQGPGAAAAVVRRGGGVSRSLRPLTPPQSRRSHRACPPLSRGFMVWSEASLWGRGPEGTVRGPGMRGGESRLKEASLGRQDQGGPAHPGWPPPAENYISQHASLAFPGAMHDGSPGPLIL